jgi:hypothetical protein
MTIALRQSFGTFAGGVEHAYALATLARANRAPTDRLVHAPVRSTVAAASPDALLLDDLRQRTDLDPEWRLVALLQDLMTHAGYTLEDLRREGFADTMLDAARALRKLAW